MVNKTKVLVKLLIVFGLFFLWTDGAWANDLAGMSNIMTSQAKSVSQFIKVVAMLAGFIASIFGINGIIQAKKQQQPMSGPIVTLLVGVALLSAVTIINSLTASSVGDGTSAGISVLGL